MLLNENKNGLHPFQDREIAKQGKFFELWSMLTITNRKSPLENLRLTIQEQRLFM